MSDDYHTLSRDVDAVKIPAGAPCILPAGTHVHITQDLGGSYTVLAPEHGGLFRIQGKDGDAIGRAQQEAAKSDGPFEIEKVWAQLRNVYDPEIPVNIVDLGLIYDVAVEDTPDGKSIAVKMTLTAPGCGMGPTLAAEAQGRILTITGVAAADVALVWDPQWNPTMISPAGKVQLGIE